MAFRPHKGVCSCHGKPDRWILNKKGQCAQGRNEARNNNKKIKISTDRGEWGAAKPGLSRRRVRQPVRKVSLEKTNSIGKRIPVEVVYKAKKRKPIQRRRKPTGEWPVFKEIGEERGPASQISGKTICLSDVRCYSHVLAKGSYPRFRLYKKNIVLKTPEEHDLYEFHTDKIKDLPEWKWLFELKEELKKEYYANNFRET